MNSKPTFEIDNQEHLDLLVANRIEAEDAARQTKTAHEIIHRFQTQPGLILADEVGMGKTFVALAVAAAAHFNDPDRNPVVVMVPPALSQKWPTDAAVFREKCLKSPWKEQFRFNEAPITSGTDFLKTLDDPEERKLSVVFITHGALYRNLADNWVKLAILRRSLHGRHNVDDIRLALSRFAGDLLRMKRSVSEEAWAGLLDRDPAAWLSYLKKNFPESAPEDNDDPVPAHLWEAIQDPGLKPALENIRLLLERIPKRDSKNFGANITQLRQQLKDELDELWKHVKGRMKLRLPLLIFDEAHHLKNAETQLVKSLFKSGGDDAESVNGAFHGVFSKMLFLTATPFQLGHYELISVLRHFEAVAWPSPESKADYALALEALNGVLDQAQESAIRLDQAWSRLRPDDLVVGGHRAQDEEAWWGLASAPDAILTELGMEARRQAQATEARMRESEKLLRPWVLRHLKARQMVREGHAIPRRESFPGKGILDPKETEIGLDVCGPAALPFLLAARTVAMTPSGRAVYAEGLASSYEAFLNTHKNRQPDLDQDEEATAEGESPQTRWYADAIQKALSVDAKGQSLPGHPKVEATVQKVLALWESGEKVVVFCHYIETGRALRLAISKAIQGRILDLAAAKMPGATRDDVAERLEDYGDKFFDSDGEARLHFDRVAQAIVDQYPATPETRKQLVDVMRRFVRTPAYLARFFALDNDLSPDAIDAALLASDGSGLNLRAVFEGFLKFLAERCQEREREEYLAAVDSVQTGSHRVAATERLIGEDGNKGEGALPNVRLVNGTTRADARRKLMLTFNTPFYPEILIASAVLAEGVDLHLNCRYIIHHDLCWNPSTLEQRTGRVDRIGAKAEKSHRSIEIFLPYVGGTQDEKMYRVVMDRERWFKVVMGEEMKTDTANVERLAARIPLPLSLAGSLAFKLEAR